MNGHGIDHAKTRAGKGSCQPGYEGKPFTCLCGDGPFTLPELYDHMVNAPADTRERARVDRTLARLPIIDDPAVSEALVALGIPARTRRKA